MYGTILPVSTVYFKNSNEWKLTYSNIQSATYKYTIVAAVPMSNILEAANRVNHSINMFIIAICIGFLFVVSIFMFGLVRFIKFLGTIFFAQLFLPKSYF